MDIMLVSLQLGQIINHSHVPLNYNFQLLVFKEVLSFIHKGISPTSLHILFIL